MEIRYSKTSCSISQEEPELEVEIFPNLSHNNIAEIKAKFGKHSTVIPSSELHRLPLAIKGLGNNLSEKLDFSIRNKLDRNGNYEIFVTGLATTLVQFKFLAQVFPSEKAPTAISCTDLLNKEVFKRIAKYKAHNQLTRNWISSLIEFWNKWQHMFTQDEGYVDVRLTKAEQEIKELKAIVGEQQILINEMRIALRNLL